MKVNITKEPKSKITHSKMFWIFLLSSLAGLVFAGLFRCFARNVSRKRI